MMLAALPLSASAWTLHGDIYTSFTIGRRDPWGGLCGSWYTTTWTGKEVIPNVAIRQDCSEVIDGNYLHETKYLQPGKDYEVTLGNNVDVGYCTVNVTGIGDYSDVNIEDLACESFLDCVTQEEYLYAERYGLIKGPIFVIAPLGTTLNKVTPQKKAVKVTWKRQAKKMSVKRITGYQIQVSTNKDFNSDYDDYIKTVNVKGYKNTSKTIKKLKGKKKYYVRVRTYFECKDGFKAYSDWSKPKAVTTKK